MKRLAQLPAAVLLLTLLVLYVGIAVATAPAAEPIFDEIRFMQHAENLTNGYWTRDTDPGAFRDGMNHTPDLWFGPGLPSLLAPLVAADVPLELIRMNGPTLFFLAVVVFYALLRLYVAREPALVGAFLLGLYYPIYSLLNYTHTELLAIFLVVSTMFCTVRWLREGRWHWLFLAAGALAWLSLTRVAYGYVTAGLLVAAGVWALARRRCSAPRRLAAVCAGALVLAVPWLAYTYSETDKLFYWGSSGGMSLYWMASPDPENLGEWFCDVCVFRDERLASHRPFFRHLLTLDGPIERDDAYRAEAVRQIEAHPLHYARNVGANMSRLWFNLPFSFGSPSKATYVQYVLPNGLLLAALFASAIVLVRHRRRVPVEVVAFAAFAVGGFAVHALLAAYARMMMPLVPVYLFLALYAGLVVLRLQERVRGRGRLAVADEDDPRAV